jgi:hypothetical protein
MAQYGVVTIDGQDYVERAQVFPAIVNITTNNQILIAQRVVLPGVANFLLKGLTRETVDALGFSQALRFRFRLGNSDGGTWYISAGIGEPNDRVIDTAVFGTGQFPFVLIPPIPYSAGANITYEIEDVSGQAPYVINLAFHGSYLIPVASTQQMAAGG